jgi:acyl-CoA thioester hydrolase
MDQPMDVLKTYPVVLEQAVAWGEMDAYGHVNNTVYFRYFENVRIAYFRKLGWEVSHLPRGIGPILHSTSARFRRPLVYPDTVSIAATVAMLGEDRFSMEYLVVSHTLQAVTAEGQGIIVAYDYATGRKAVLPEWVCERIHEVQAGFASVRPFVR